MSKVFAHVYLTYKFVELAIPDIITGIFTFHEVLNLIANHS
jgi:hypothetical protein